MSESLDTFNSPAPVEAAAPNSTGNEAEDTFDSFEVKELDSGQEEVKAEEVKDSQVNQLGDERTSTQTTETEAKKDDVEGAKAEDAAAGDGKDGEVAEKDGELKADEAQDKPAAKTIKAKVDGEEVEINPGAELRVKVKGKNVDVSVQDLMNNYSGKVNYDKKFNELNTERKTLEKESTLHQEEATWLKGKIEDVVSLLDNSEKDPMEAMLYLLDATGRNPLDYQQRMMERQLGQLDELSEMDEVERELYWKKKENEYLRNRQETSANQAKAAQVRQEQTAGIAKMRESLGVTEDQYVDAKEELSKLGVENASAEQAVKYAAVLPHMVKAEGLLETYADEMEPEKVNELITEIGLTLQSGDLTVEEVKSLLNSEFGTSNAEGALAEKMAASKIEEVKVQPTEKVAAKEGGVESFDDYDSFEYNQQY